MADAKVITKRALLSGAGATAVAAFLGMAPKAKDKFSPPEWFDAYERQMWNKLMRIGRIQEITGKPIGEVVAEAMRTRTLPWWLQHAEKMKIPPDAEFD